MLNRIKSLLALALLMAHVAKAETQRADCEQHLPAPRELQAIAEPLPTSTLIAEMQREAQLLIDTTPENADKGYQVFIATGARIPQTMLELGRLREIAFRSVGEGTGQARDIDAFDEYYYQLVSWDKKRKTISGGYRLGKVGRILSTYGPDGLYSFSLFDFSELLKHELSANTLEVGRSFVLPEFKKGLTLSVLWAGIARFLVLNPEYRHLVGPVSISGDFLESSKALITEYLMTSLSHPRANTVTPRVPPRFQSPLTREEIEGLLAPVHTIKDLEQAVKITENDEQAKLPPLIKIYLELNVRFLGFNWDASFNALDGLIWTDISQLSIAVMSKYMGAEGAASYFHAQEQAGARGIGF